MRGLESAPAGDPAALAAAREKLHAQDKLVRDLVERAQGEAGKELSQARVERWDQSLGKRAAAKLFEAQLLCYQAAPKYFLAGQHADLIASLPPDSRKYIIDVDPTVKPVWQIEMKDEINPLEQILPTH